MQKYGYTPKDLIVISYVAQTRHGDRNKAMIFGIKCEGCKMWTRIIKWQLWHHTDSNKPYYCNECENKVTYHTSKATLTLT